MASKKEIEQHLKIALEEIGEIKPIFSKRFNVWIFKHSAYPDVEYAGESEKEVIRNFPLYLRDFIKHRLDANIDPLVEKKTKGRGGKRGGAGRPKGTKKEPTERISLPKDVAQWIKQPESITKVRALIAKKR
jgi:hypothetical protein